MNIEGNLRKVLAGLAVFSLVAASFVAPVGSQAAVDCASLINANNGQLSYDQLLQKQNCVQQELNKNQQNLKATQQQASDLQAAISSINGSIGQTQNQIVSTQNQIETTSSIIDSLSSQLDQTHAKLDDLNTKLKSAYSNLYELSQTSTVEMLLQSKSLNDLLSQTQYIQSIQTDLQKNIGEANSLAASLQSEKAASEQQKANLQGFNDQLNHSKASLDAQKSQKNYLLAQTQGDQAKYASLLASLKNEATKISSDLYQKRLQLGGFINGGGNGGYPYANSTPDIPDQWGFLTRECTSYAAFAFQRNFGRAFTNTRPGSGSAYNWPNLAHDQGYHTSGSPTVGDIVSWPAGSYTSQWGHVAAIEVVYSSHDVVVSEYNWNRYAYSERRIDPTTFGSPTYIHP